MAIKQSTRALRLASICAANIGIIVNIIALIVMNETRRWSDPWEVCEWAFLPLILSAIGNYAILNGEKLLKRGFPRGVLLILDLCAFGGFLALLIENGIVAGDVWPVHADKVQLMAYNAMPWILCSGIHVALAAQEIYDIIRLGFPKCKTRCADCNRMLGQRMGKSTDDEASLSLLRPEYDPQEDGASNA